MHLNKLLKKKAVIDDAYVFCRTKRITANHSPGLHYSVFAGGKRIRPILALQTAELFSPNWRRIIPPACALG